MVRSLARIARRQHGLLTRAQALNAMTRHQLATALVTGAFEAIRPGVIRVAGSPDTWEQAILAACLAGGQDCVASFTSAARLWGLARFEARDELHITTPTRRRVRLQGVLVHDSAILTRQHVTKRQRMPVTSVARTLCDLTACCTPWQVEHAVDNALTKRLVTLEQLQRVFLDLATRGRRRSTIMRAILEDRVPGLDKGESPPEDRLARWLVRAGLPTPAQQHRVVVAGRVFRLDLAYPDAKIGVEYDGWEAHGSRSAFDADRSRDIALENAGWRVLHFTSRSTQEFVVASVRRALLATSV